MPNIAEASYALYNLYLGSDDFTQEQKLEIIGHCKFIAQTLHQNIDEGVLKAHHFSGLKSQLAIKINAIEKVEKKFQQASALAQQQDPEKKPPYVKLHHFDRTIESSMNFFSIIATYDKTSQMHPKFFTKDVDVGDLFNAFCMNIGGIEQFITPGAETITSSELVTSWPKSEYKSKKFDAWPSLPLPEAASSLLAAAAEDLTSTSPASSAKKARLGGALRTKTAEASQATP